MQEKLSNIFAILTLPITIVLCVLDDKFDIGDFGERLPYRPRIFNFIWASWFSFFWLPCSSCRKYFGGHEKSYSVQTSVGGGTSYCFRCKEKADKYNAENKERLEKATQEHYSQFFVGRHNG